MPIVTTLYPSSGYYDIVGPSGTDGSYISSYPKYFSNSDSWQYLDGSLSTEGIDIGIPVSSGELTSLVSPTTPRNTISIDSISGVYGNYQLSGVLELYPNNPKCYITAYSHSGTPFVSASNFSNQNNDFSVTIPTPHYSGDLLFISMVAANSTISTPANWNLFNGYVPLYTSVDGISLRLYHFWKRATSSSEPSLSFTTGVNQSSITALVLKNVYPEETGENISDYFTNYYSGVQSLSYDGDDAFYSKTFNVAKPSTIISTALFNVNDEDDLSFSSVYSSGLTNEFNLNHVSVSHYGFAQSVAHAEQSGLANIYMNCNYYLGINTTPSQVAHTIIGLKGELRGSISNINLFSRKGSTNHLLMSSSTQVTTSTASQTYEFPFDTINSTEVLEAVSSGFPLVLSAEFYNSGNPATDINSVGFRVSSMRFGYSNLADSTSLYPSGLPLTVWMEGISGDLPLYLNNATLYSGNFPLYTKVDDVTSHTGSMNLIVWPEGSSSGISTGNTNLFIENKEYTSGELPLYITGPDIGYISGNFPLFLQLADYEQSGYLNLFTLNTDSGVLSTSLNNMSLYINNYSEFSGDLPLYTIGPDLGYFSGVFPLLIKAYDEIVTESTPISLNNYFNLITEGPVLFNGSLPFVLSANLEHSGNFPLYISSDTAGQSSGNIPLNMAGEYPVISSQITLYTNTPSTTNKNFNLYTYGTIDSVNSGIPLFIRNNYYDILDSNTPLFISNRLDSSGTVSLYTIAGMSESLITLYTGSEIQYSDMSGDLSLYINSFSNSGIANAFDLFMESSLVNSDFPLYISVDSNAFFSGDIPLYMNSDYTNPHTEHSLTLFIESIRETYKSLNLYTSGDGFLPGASVFRSGVPLSIGNGDTIDYYSPLFLQSTTGFSGLLPLYINGGTYVNNSLDLALPNVTYDISGDMVLYTHGF